MSGEVLVLWIICFGDQAVTGVTKGFNVAYDLLICANIIELYVKTYMNSGRDLHFHSHIRARPAPQ